jgi:hypothetical protein
MKQGDILTVLFHIGDQVVRLRRTIEKASEHLRNEERTKLLAALEQIERRNVELLGEMDAIEFPS